MYVHFYTRARNTYKRVGKHHTRVHATHLEHLPLVIVGEHLSPHDGSAVLECKNGAHERLRAALALHAVTDLNHGVRVELGEDACKRVNNKSTIV